MSSCCIIIHHTCLPPATGWEQWVSVARLKKELGCFVLLHPSCMPCMNNKESFRAVGGGLNFSGDSGIEPAPSPWFCRAHPSLEIKPMTCCNNMMRMNFSSLCMDAFIWDHELINPLESCELLWFKKICGYLPIRELWIWGQSKRQQTGVVRRTSSSSSSSHTVCHLLRVSNRHIYRTLLSVECFWIGNGCFTEPGVL